VVATAYAEKVAREPRRRQLDLQGEQLVYGGDTDIAYTGIEMGLGMGVFTSLRITHLTPTSRCTEEYLLKNYEAHAYSEVLHHWVEHGTIPKQRTDLRGRLGVFARRILGSPLERKMIAARARGVSRGGDFVRGRMSEVRAQRTEIGDQISEASCQKPDDSIPEAGVPEARSQ
jgi:hypothetical protein